MQIGIPQPNSIPTTNWNLAATQLLAPVLGKLLTEAFLRVRRALERFQRYFKVSRTTGTDATSRNSPDPFDYPQIALFHAVSLFSDIRTWLRLRLAAPSVLGRCQIQPYRPPASS